MNDDERQARLAAIRERLNAATPGPWEFDSYCRVLAPPAHLDDAEHYGNIVAWVPAWHGDTACKPHDDNAELIANAPADLAWLLAEVERLTRQRDAARAWSARWKAVAKRVWTGVHHPLDMCEFQARKREAAEAERDAATARAERAEAALRSVMAWAEDRGYLDPGGHEDDGPSEDLWAAMFAALRTYSAALAEQGEAG